MYGTTLFMIPLCLNHFFRIGTILTYFAEKMRHNLQHRSPAFAKMKTFEIIKRQKCNLGSCQQMQGIYGLGICSFAAVTLETQAQSQNTDLGAEANEILQQEIS